MLLRGLVIGSLLLLSACATRPELNASADFPSAEPVIVSSLYPDYRIGPNDRLGIKVFQVAGLDREVRVDNAGNISLPLAGALSVAGKTVSETQAVIQKAFSERYLQDPQVSVMVLDRARQRVTVEGAVASPGIYPIDTQLTLLQAIALAKGPSNVADEHDIIVFRTLGGQRHVARFDLKAIRAGTAADPQLMGEDIIVVAESGSKVWLRRLVEVTPLIGVWTLFR
ncbi:MAG: polysaccharide export protein [Frankiaceae bacterium]|nr:polysaccharide export protein [Arenimonas sp.]